MHCSTVACVEDTELEDVGDKDVGGLCQDSPPKGGCGLQQTYFGVLLSPVPSGNATPQSVSEEARLKAATCIKNL